MTVIAVFASSAKKIIISSWWSVTQLAASAADGAKASASFILMSVAAIEILFFAASMDAAAPPPAVFMPSAALPTESSSVLAFDRSISLIAAPISSHWVPNSARPTSLRFTGSSMARSESITLSDMFIAASPPLPNSAVVSSTFRPRVSKAPAVDSLPSSTRIENSLMASAARSVSRAPPRTACEIRPIACSPSIPSLRNWVPYSFMVSSRSSDRFRPFCCAAVSRSKASAGVSTSPVLII